MECVGWGILNCMVVYRRKEGVLAPVYLVDGFTRTYFLVKFHLQCGIALCNVGFGFEVCALGEMGLVELCNGTVCGMATGNGSLLGSLTVLRTVLELESIGPINCGDDDYCGHVV
jgi:hypothetical protein